ncbi:hypothetical protein AMTR_s00114p00022200 [Amborella trichopoda]|uniref:Uncharacterized protein n=1 Tax=Amborella trichopoda TaxID=13333 RepID=W1NTP3_AMBTC|nr:hypothetical protein AMTR_s00114p00022200 [Amborella trichopoda]
MVYALRQCALAANLMEFWRSSVEGPRSGNGASRAATLQRCVTMLQHQTSGSEHFGATTLRRWWTTLRQWTFWSHIPPARVDHAPAMEILEPHRSGFGGPRSGNGASGATVLRRSMTTLRQYVYSLRHSSCSFRH